MNLCNGRKKIVFLLTLVLPLAALPASADKYLDEVNPSDLAAAVAGLPKGGTLHLAAGTYSISATISLVSNLTIECSPDDSTILQASSELKRPMFLARGVHHFRIAGCVIDGNWHAISSAFPLLVIDKSTQGEIEKNHFQNGRMRLIEVDNSSYLRITDNEFDHYGSPVPAGNGNEGVALSGGNTHTLIDHNTFHDGNIGIGVYPSATAANLTFDLDISHNRVFSQSHVGILVYSVTQTGSLMTGKLESNDVECSGWSANGNGWNSIACPPGVWQTGPVASTDGSGFDLNSSLMDQWQVINNQARYNYLEGFNNTAQVISTVKTQNGKSGSCPAYCVLKQEGDNFDTTWKSGQAISIPGSNCPSSICLITSVQSTTLLTLQSHPGSLSGAQMTAPAYARSVFQGNVACFNGNGQPARSVSGHGFSDISRGSTYNGNLACQNWATGFIDNMSAFITHNGDKAISNNRGGAVGAGISDWFGLDNSYIGVTTDDNTPGNLQSLGVGFSRSTNGYLESSSLCNYSTCNSASLVADSGTNDVILIGKNFPSQAMRVSGCATPASVGASCTVTVTWHTPYADTNYTATCTGDLVTSGVPVDGGITAKSPSSITFRTVAATAAAAQFTSIGCIAKHD